MRTWLIFYICCLNLITGCSLFDNNSDNSAVPKQKQTWTLMVYANADNNLESFLVADAKEMELAGYDATKLKVILLLDRVDGYSSAYGDWRDTRLFEIAYNPDLETFTSQELDSIELSLSVGSQKEELDMGNWQTLANFIDFCQNNYQSDNYALLISDHGDGWYTKELTKRALFTRGVSQDYSSDSYIGTDELKLALTGKGISVLAFDACAMGTIEVLYELRDCAEYIVTTTRPVPDSGYNYSFLLSELGKELYSPAEFAAAFLTGYEQSYNYDNDIIMRYDVAKITTAVEGGLWQQFVTHVLDQEKSSLALAVASSIRYKVNSKNVYIDLIDLSERVGDVELSSALKDATSGINPERKMLSVFFPEALCYYESRYSNTLDLTVNSQWDEFLLDFLRFSDNYRDLHEPDNNYYASAPSVPNGHSESSYIAAAYDKDIFTLIVSSAGTVAVSLDNIPATEDYSFVLNSAFLPDVIINADGDSKGAGQAEYMSVWLEPGVYYITVAGNYGSDYSYYEPYMITFSGSAMY